MSPDSPQFPPEQPGQSPPPQPIPPGGVPGDLGQPIYPARRRISVGVILAAIGGGGLLLLLCCGALLLPAIQAAREAARQANCMSNMKMIAVAMLNYHDANGAFPPAFTVDEAGQPMHSWRALLLPYLEVPEAEVAAQQYKFDEPWNGPNNSRLAEQMPEVFRCPSEPNQPGQTSYVAVVGPETIWSGPSGTPIRKITDGTSRTIAFVEAAASGINWLEPRDLSFDDALGGINGPAAPGIASAHPGAVYVAFCDGSVLRLEEGTDPQTLRAFLTSAGGDGVNDDVNVEY